MPRRKADRIALRVLGQFADEFDLDDAQFLVVLGMRRHGRTQGRDHGQRNRLGRVDLEQRADFRALVGILDAVVLGIDEDHGMGAGHGDDAADAFHRVLPEGGIGRAWHLLAVHGLFQSLNGVEVRLRRLSAVGRMTETRVPTPFCESMRRSPPCRRASA